MEAMPRVYRNAVKVQQTSILLLICVWPFFFESQKEKKKADTLPPQETRKHIPPNREVGKIIDDSKVPRYMVGDM